MGRVEGRGRGGGGFREGLFASGSLARSLALFFSARPRASPLSPPLPSALFLWSSPQGRGGAAGRGGGGKRGSALDSRFSRMASRIVGVL
jgi:hypothetical protein